MQYKVLVGFSGAISAPANAVITITDKVITEDLLKAGYIAPVKGDADSADTTDNAGDAEEKPKKTNSKANKKTDGE